MGKSTPCGTSAIVHIASSTLHLSAISASSADVPTNGVTSIAFACASEMDVLGPNDYALFRDPSTQAVIGAVAKIDLQPLSSNLVPTAVRGMGPRASLVRPSAVIPASPTGVPMDKVKTP